MRGKTALLTAMAALLNGCATQAPWPDRPWLDAGCDATGACAVRGRLEILRGVPHSGGVLTLPDGSCMAVALPEEILTDWRRWSGRQVAIRGRTVARGGESAEIASIQYGDRFVPTGLCPSGPMLYANRLSLKVAR